MMRGSLKRDGVRVRVVSSALAGEVGREPTVFYALIGGSAAYLMGSLWRFLLPASWPFHPNLWFNEHLVKMLASSRR
jgi:hypothetical protein